MRVSLIVAMAENGVIGRGGKLPWRLSADLRRFRQLTMGHHVIMGRKTFESIGRPLPGRKLVILTRQADFHCPDAIVVHGWAEALAVVAGDEEPFVIGGAEIFQLALPHVTRMYMTVVHDRPEGDVRFPTWDQSAWRLISEEHIPADEKNSAATTFRILERISPCEDLTMADNLRHELLDLNARLLRSIQDGDWSTYEQLCDPTLTAFEPEARGHLVEGMRFHEFYFNLERKNRPINTTMASPHVRLLGENAAVVSYVRLVQTIDESGQPYTRRSEETRVWERRDGVWKHVHFHRSANE